MRKLAAAAGVLFLLPLTLTAQTPKAELFTGVSYLRLEKQNRLGWDASINAILNKNLGFVADASGYYNSESRTSSGITTKTSGSIHSILVGPRVAEPAGKFTPYAQALFGWSRLHDDSSSSTSNGVFLSSVDSRSAFAMALGAGMDFAVNHSLSIRIVQVDYMLIRSRNQKPQGVRLGAGLVFRLGQRK